MSSALIKGTPVFQYSGDGMRFGQIKSKIMCDTDGWAYYLVDWAEEELDTNHYRADKIKVLNVDREMKKLHEVERMLSNSAIVRGQWMRL